MHEKTGELLDGEIQAGVEDVSQLIDGLEEQLVVYSTAARNVRDTTRSLLSEESIEHFTRANCPDYDDNDRRNRSREEQAKRYTTDQVKVLLVNAKLWAFIYTDPQSPDDKKAEAEVFRRESEEQTEGKQEFHHLLDVAWSRIFDTEVERCKSEQQIRSSLSEFLSAHPTNVITFIERVLDSDAQEYRDLLGLLYKDREDEMIAGLVGNAVNSLYEQTEYLTDGFVDHLDNLADPRDKSEDDVVLSEETRSWLGWIASHNLISLPVRELLQGQPIETWPTALQESFATYSHNRLDELWNAYSELTGKFANKAIFTVKIKDLEHIQARAQGNVSPPSGSAKSKKTRPKGGRVTAKVSSDTYLDVHEEEQSIVFTSLARVAQTPRGWVVQDECPLEKEAKVEDLLSIPEVEKYLSKYTGDHDIASDIEAMLDSILREPYNNGASKLKGQMISIVTGKRAQERPIWHLNPNKRSGLSIGTVGRKTRIYYAIHPDRDRKQLLLIDVAHKNGAEQLSSTNFRRTS